MTTIPAVTEIPPGSTGAILSARIVCFSARDPFAPEWLALCLTSGRLPVIIGNAIVLPLAEHIDYSDSVLTVGDTPVEVAMLAELPHLSDAEIDRRSRQCVRIGRDFYNASFVEKTYPAMRDHTTVLHQPCSALNLPDGKNPFPAFTTGGELISEADLFRQMWMHLGQRFNTEQSKPVLLWGAGRFLRRMLGCVGRLPGGPAIIGIADDQATAGQALYDLPVRRPDCYSPADFSAVLLATDSAEELLFRRCREVYGSGTAVLRPSILMRMPSESGIPVSRNEHADPRHIAADTLNRTPSLPNKVEAVMVCVGYSDMLSWTLRLNRHQFDNIAVVTSSTDIATQAVAKKNGARLVISDRYVEDGAPFNKGKMLNDGLRALDLDDWVLFTDSDMIFPDGLTRRLRQRALHRDCLYYATRVDAPESRLDEWLSDYTRDPDLINRLPFDRPGRNRMPWGYFQLVNMSAQTLRHRTSHVYDESFHTAGDVDYEFQEMWPERLRILLPELTVHIPHGKERTNWRGRRSPQHLNVQ